MRQPRAPLTLVLALLLTLPLAGVAGADERGQAEERRPENPGEQAEDRRQDGDARATQAQSEQAENQGRSEDAPHGHAYGHDREPGEPAQPPSGPNGNNEVRAEGQAEDDENIPSGNKGTVKVRSHGADPYPPRTEPHVDCIFDVLFYGFASSGATATLATQAPTSPTGQQVGPALSASWDPANRPGSEYLDRVTFDLRGVIDNGDFTYHEQQGYHLKLTVTNDDREAPGNRKHKVFWVDCPPAPAEVEGAAEDVSVLGALIEADEAAAIVVEEDEAVDVEVAGVLEERAAVAAAAGQARPAAQVPAGVLAVTGIGLLALLLLGLASIGGGIGALRWGRK